MSIPRGRYADVRAARWSIAVLLVMVACLLLFSSSVAAAGGHKCSHAKRVRLQKRSSEAAGQPAVVKIAASGDYRGFGLAGSDRNASVPSVRAGWEPIRIASFMHDAKNSQKHCPAVGVLRPDFQGDTVMCGPKDVITPAKITILETTLVPVAVKLHTDRLRVERLTQPLVVPRLTGDACGSFTIPPAHQSGGVPNTDFIIYISAGPTEDGDLAWGMYCVKGPNNRPLVGVMNIASKAILSTPVASRTVAHELLHALGFDYHLFAARPGMLVNRNIRGKPTAKAMASPIVVVRARQHYNCLTVDHMELEDEEDSDDADEPSHWKGRNAFDELMAPSSDAGYYTAMTIGAMEDLGFYKGDFSKAEPMAWGKSAGCSFLTQKCIINGVTSFPNMFCTAENSLSCTVDRLAVGMCGIRTYSANLPVFFQYFPNARRGGDRDFLDYCPIYVRQPNARCDESERLLPGSVFASTARCFNGNQLTLASGAGVNSVICVDVKCTATAYTVRLHGSTTYVACTAGGTISVAQSSTAFKAGTINCPPYNDVCVGNV